MNEKIHRGISRKARNKQNADPQQKQNQQKQNKTRSWGVYAASTWSSRSISMVRSILRTFSSFFFGIQHEHRKVISRPTKKEKNNNNNNNQQQQQQRWGEIVTTAAANYSAKEQQETRMHALYKYSPSTRYKNSLI